MVTLKTFKSTFQLTHPLVKAEKLKVILLLILLGHGGLASSYVLFFFHMDFEFLYLFNLSGKKVDSDADTTTEEDVLSKVTVVLCS